jgi:Zn-dependent protease with chaperone function
VVRARYYDGRTSQAREVVLSRQAGELAVEGEGLRLTVPLREVRVSEALARAPRLLALPGGGRCEVDPGPALELLLELLGHREGRVSRWQRRSSLAVACAAATLLALAGGYRWGLPWLAESVAQGLPEAWVGLLGAHTLETLDETVFAESALDAGRRERLAARLAALRGPAGELPDHSLHFRDGGPLGANAFALPGGEIVVTDGLVELAASDEEVLGVVAHELGHVQERHVLRGAIQGSLVGMLVAVWLGDVGSFATALPAAVLEARYSRDFEREADAYAARLLVANGMDTRPLADLLVRLEARTGGPSGPPGLSAYLSTHPATAERLRALAGDD